MSVVLHCPNKECRKPILTKANLPVGTEFNMRCPNCELDIEIRATPREGIQRKLLRGHLQDFEDSDIVYLSID